ncbi:winged helix DNA-binding domain-containing protein [Microbacterium protaetiae]|uniref:Winged helix DNA-binding domain-containing protein n=1 Tax=Microbacterium protaetiae TaxID=2509458 RepID=A0A4P6ECW5_9MICO|nr:winged helix DNA-binding domain-containing protein [Microbacterium protaetiae]QAY58869.1 winged helix DNA-binding domain-containing protein [Microbacterium protaetiae]
MDLTALRSERLRSHRLDAPAATVQRAAGHMLAVQAQDFWGGRWALASRTRGEPRLSQVDAVFDDGSLVRSWTMRGTLHLIPAADLPWVLSVTGERQWRQAASLRRTLGLDDATVARAETLLRAGLRGGGRLTRTEALDMLTAGGIDPGAGRGLQLLFALSVRGVLVQGPVVTRTEGLTRDQYLVLAEEWVRDAATPADPVGEMFVRYIIGHGPASAGDFAWWAGLPLTAARAAAARAVERVREVEDGVFAASAPPRREPHVPTVRVLPSYEEYVIAYADRSVAADDAALAVVTTGGNGMVRPVILAEGEVAGIWNHSRAVGRHNEMPVPELFDGYEVDEDALAAALDRYSRFIAG